MNVKWEGLDEVVWLSGGCLMIKWYCFRGFVVRLGS